jgi:hypothetical protein
MAINAPSDIPGLLLDLDPHAEAYQDAAGTTPATSAGDPVGNLPDQTGQQDALTQTTSAARPTLRSGLNGWRYLEGDGVDDTIDQTTFDAGPQPFSIIDVPHVTGGGNTLVTIEDGGNNWFGSNPADKPKANWGSGAEGHGISPVTGSVIGCTIDSNATFYEDGSNIITQGVGTSSWVAGVGLFNLFNNYHVGSYRILVYDGALTDAQHADVAAYLSSVYSASPGGGGGGTVSHPMLLGM